MAEKYADQRGHDVAQMTAAERAALDEHNAAPAPHFAWCAGPSAHLAPHVDYPHEPGRLYDCPACESRCNCTAGYTQCVYRGPHNGSADEGTERFPTAE